MRFVDLLRITVLLSAGAATALAIVTVLAASAEADDTVVFVLAGWWFVAALIGAFVGRKAQVSTAAVPFATAIVVFAASAARTLVKLSSRSADGVDVDAVAPTAHTPVPLSVGTSRRKPGVRTSRSGRTGDVGST